MLARRVMSHGKSQLGRETYLAPMEWSEDGWPVVNGGKRITLEVEADLPKKTTPKEWKDDFTSGTLSLTITKLMGLANI
jgi:beta-xylosidase